MADFRHVFYRHSYFHHRDSGAPTADSDAPAHLRHADLGALQCQAVSVLCRQPGAATRHVGHRHFFASFVGGQGLALAGVNLAALLAIGASTSLAALALASLIATVARSVEQATVASGALNIVFAALGGIMIPTFVMPPVLQTLAQISPMEIGRA